MKKIKVSTIFIHIALLVWAFITLYPIFWVLINSFKPSADILSNSFSLPGANFTLTNFRKLFGLEGDGFQYNLMKGYMNSLIISGSVVFLVLFLGGFASFSLARYDFKGKKVVMALLVSAMMLPMFSIINPLDSLISKLGLNNKRLGVIIPQVAGNLSFAVVILTGFMQQLPLEVEESAFMDGANVFQVLFYLVFPMAKSSFATTGIFVFLWSFNDLFLQRRFISKEGKLPIVVVLERISADTKYGADFGLKSAAAVMAIIPVLIVYLILQKHIIEGLTAGAIKG